MRTALILALVFTCMTMSGLAKASNTLKSVDYEVFGRVQGVCFRMYTEDEAKKLGVVGWVKNTRQGTVVGQVQGPEEKVSAMPNTYRLFDEKLYNVSLDEKRLSCPPLFIKSNKPPPHPRSPNRNNMPHSYYAKFIRDNVRFLNEPVIYMGTANTKNKQTEWWPRTEENVPLHKPSYDRTSTQRSSFGNLAYSSHQTRHGCNPHKTPLRGIVPLASPRDKNRLPKLLQEQISFLHQYDSRLTPNEPIRGTRHGGFVWREIKTESGPGVPQGTRPFLNAIGSHACEQPQTERGNSVESSMTSPSSSLLGSQQMLNSEVHLSKTELREAAKTNPNITAKEQNGSGSSQTSRRKALAPIGGFMSSHPVVNPK